MKASGLRFAVVCSRWNPTVTDALLSSALRTLEARGARAGDVEVIRVPGAFELPAAAACAMRRRPRPDAVIVLGAIVRGETPHHEVLGHAVASALASLSTEGFPIGFGLLTCDTMEQAHARAAKGVEAAEAAVEMANLRRELVPAQALSSSGRTRKVKNAARRTEIDRRSFRSTGRPNPRSIDRRRH